jgi:hypothetical protein
MSNYVQFGVQVNHGLEAFLHHTESNSQFDFMFSHQLLVNLLWQVWVLLLRSQQCPWVSILQRITGSDQSPQAPEDLHPPLSSLVLKTQLARSTKIHNFYCTKDTFFYRKDNAFSSPTALLSSKNASSKNILNFAQCMYDKIRYLLTRMATEPTSLRKAM